MVSDTQNTVDLRIDLVSKYPLSLSPSRTEMRDGTKFPFLKAGNFPAAPF